MHRFLRPVALLALPLLLAACGSHGTSSAIPQMSGEAAPLGGSFGQLVARSMDPNIRQVCGAVQEGYARCFSFVRTDVGGHITPDVGGYGPADLQSAYNLPSATKGAEQTVGIVDAFDDPTAESDLAIYRSNFGLSECSTANHCFRKVNQRGVRGHYPGPNSGWAQEISLDVDMVSAICPKCHILLVEGDDNSFHALADSVITAARLGANAISNSYGGGESGGVGGNNYAYHHPGHMITASTGDGGFGPQFPAGSQYVTAVGGTTLQRGGGTRGWTETVWSGAGSGCSQVFPKPAWQHDTGCSMRTIGDVSADANPSTGVAVVYNGRFLVFGGTSVSSPIIASVYALGAHTQRLQFARHGYMNTGDLFDVTSGSNGHCSPAYLCTGEIGYDGPTGNGTPNGVGAF